MKLIGRRWAKLSDLQNPGYTPQLNNQQPRNSLQMPRNLTPEQQENQNVIGSHPIMYGPNSENNYSNEQNLQNYNQPMYNQNSIQQPNYIDTNQYNYQPMQNNQQQNNAYGYNPQTDEYYPIVNNGQPSQRIGGYTRYTHEYLLDNGQIVTTEQAYDLAMKGMIEGVECSSNKGTKYIRSIGDGNMKNNLDDLPEF